MPSPGAISTTRPTTVRHWPDGRGATAAGLGPGALAGASDAVGLGRRTSSWRIAVLAALLLALLAWPVSRLFSDSHHAPAIGAAHRPGLASLPLEAQAPVSAALGAATPGYAARVEKGALVTSNAAQRLSARFDRSGAHVRAGGVGFGLTLDSVDQGSSLRSLAGVAPRGDANRVVYAYPGVSESFVNGPLGLDQRFTLARAPGHGGGPLTLSLSLSGDVHARVLAGGKGLVFVGTGGHVLDYRALAASDARGRALRAWLSVRGSRLLLHVDARGARYPVSIDPLMQQGPQLTDLGGEGEVGDGLFGASIALSSDGSTVLVGAPREYRQHTGAAFVFVRSGSMWSQQAELQDSEISRYEEFGASVALSADGNTAAIGSPGDNDHGAVSVFTRSGSSWSEQTKLVADCTSECANQGTGETSGLFGVSVGLSSDGNTLIAGAPYDETSEGAYDEGAAWVFTRSGPSWTQQAQLVGDCTSGCTNEGSGESAYGYFGNAVALSGDGNTAVIGAPDDESGIGASWIFARSGSSWSEQSKLVADCTSSCANEGTGESGSGDFGNSVAVSEDGSTALIAGDYDSSGKGAAWIFTSSGASWTEQTELVGDCTISCANQATGESGNGEFGTSTALSSDGDTAVIGARGDEGAIGAAWVLKRSGSSWTQDGAKLVADCTVNCEDEGTGETGNNEEHNQFGYGVSISPDGSTVMIGAPAEYNGGVWAFTPVSTGTGLSVSPSPVDFGDIPGGQVSAPQTVTVTNPTDQEVPLSLAANGSPTPAGISDKPGLVALSTPGACLLDTGTKNPVPTVPASSSCEVGIKVLVKPAAGETTVGAFTVPVLIGSKLDAASLTLTGTGTGLSASPSPVDFGDVPDGQVSAPQTVTVTNVTDQPLPLSIALNGSPTPAGVTRIAKLVALDTPGACVDPIIAPTVLDVPASSSCEVGLEVEVKPAAGETTVGAFTVPVLIGSKLDAASLTLTGTGTGLSASPSPVDFGDVPDGQVSAPQTVTVTNVTDQPLPLSIALNGSPTPAGVTRIAKLVALDTPGACVDPIIAPTVLDVPASSSCEVGLEVEVKPAAGETTVGAFTVPVLIGSKLDAASLTLTGTGTGLSASPSPVDFGDVPDGQVSAPQTVTVTNVTDQPLPLSIALNGSPTPAGITRIAKLVALDTPGACVDPIIAPTVLDVPASSSCEVGIKVLVKPAAGETTVGAFTVPVLIGSKLDAASLTLTGTGTGLSASPSPVDFGDVPDGQVSAPQTVTVTNVTDQPLPLSIALNGSPTPAGVTRIAKLVALDTPGACVDPIIAPTVLDVPASSSCEVGLEVEVKPAAGETTVGAFTVPVLIGSKLDAASLTLTGTGTGLSASPSPVDFGDVPDGQVSAPQTVTVTNVTDQPLPLSIALNGSPTPAGITRIAKLVALDTPGACVDPIIAPTVLDVPASSSCEVGLEVEVKPAAGETTVGAFTVPVLIGSKLDAASLTLTGTGTG